MTEPTPLCTVFEMHEGVNLSPGCLQTRTPPSLHTRLNLDPSEKMILDQSK